VKIDPKTNTLVREGVASITNPFDEYASKKRFSFERSTEEKST